MYLINVRSIPGEAFGAYVLLAVILPSGLRKFRFEKTVRVAKKECRAIILCTHLVFANFQLGQVASALSIRKAMGELQVLEVGVMLVVRIKM